LVLLPDINKKRIQFCKINLYHLIIVRQIEYQDFIYNKFYDIIDYNSIQDIFYIFHIFL
jgi:hypothetical protein